MNSTGSSTTDMAPPVSQDGDLIPLGRIKDVAAARALWGRMVSDDNVASNDRAMVHAMVNGEPPYSSANYEATGRADECNVNWGRAFDLFNEAKDPLNDLIHSVGNLAVVPTNFGTLEQRGDWEQTMAEEVTRTIRGWTDFAPRYQFLVNHYVMDGLLAAHFEDCRCWQPQISSLNNWKMPRDTKASPNAIDANAFYVITPPHELYRRIKHPKEAKKAGWIVKEVERAIKDGTKISHRSDTYETLEEMFKNNDYGSTGQAPSCKLVHLLNRELNGTVSHYIFQESGEGDFLYKALGKFPSMDRAVIPFADGVGTTGHYHSIRGYMNRLFSIINHINRLRCSFYDLAKFESTPRLEAASEDDLNERAIIPWGPFMVMMGTVKEAERQPVDFQKALLPALTDIENVLYHAIKGRSGSAMMMDRSGKPVDDIENLARISPTAQNTFYNAWEPLLREMIRRLTDKDYVQSDPGGQEAWEFRQRCFKKGVPKRAIDEIDYKRIEAVRAIGNGSGIARKLIWEELDIMKPEMDEEARNFVNHSKALNIAGAQPANYIFPKKPGLRPPQDATNAEMENNFMRMQFPPTTFRPNDDHIVHTEHHIALLNEQNESLPNAQQQTEWTDIVKSMVLVQGHCINDHLPRIPERNPMFGILKKELVSLGEIIYNSTKHLQKLEAEAAQAEGGGQATPGQPGGGETAGIQTPGGSIPDTLFRQITEQQTRAQDIAFKRAQQIQALDHADKMFSKKLEFLEREKALKSA